MSGSKPTCSCDVARGRFCPSHLATLKEFTQAAEDFAGSNPDMGSHKETCDRFDKLLDAAKDLLGLA